MISVLMPVYNASKYVRESINSILNQTIENFELIICNDHSSDNSPEIIRNFDDSRIVYIENKRNEGYLKTINNLFKLCRGEFIAFQDADDVSNSQRLEMQLNHMNEYDLDLVGTNYAIITPSGNIHAKKDLETDNSRLKALLEVQNPFMKPSIMFHKNILNQIGGFREDFLKLNNISEDYDWLLRGSLYFKFGNINHKEPLYYYRSDPNAMSKNVNNIEQLFGHKICQFLFKQRKLHGTDDLDTGNYDNIYEFINQLKIPYLKDPSKFHIERAESLMYFGLYKAAIMQAYHGLKRNPTFRNFRTLQYCIRKSIFRI